MLTADAGPVQSWALFGHRNPTGPPEGPLGSAGPAAVCRWVEPAQDRRADRRGQVAGAIDAADPAGPGVGQRPVALEHRDQMWIGRPWTARAASFTASLIEGWEW